ncbi:hypothetical protein [Desulfosporosinus meridiei]|uniref:Uncharacterized protein n=1 Tax=Desulfosporosinus meridiei (strain ATCC BAA-275 / DSM 13257 / KCTC 12902 / NCIMB 13706 / S10) TaxID=768704 RepID=J7IMQ7_DESMD|nr:hypothetical protein [Desulfosporosinus meridiei]AFQ42840.1 hypothetical protein Desmer_0808 [Desulfosporosinus meridiei DSM 13257]
MFYRRSNASCRPTPNPPQCGPLPGTVLRISIPPGTVINLLNLVEVASPSGICFIIRLPFLDCGSGNAMSLDSIVNAVQSAGGRVEFD